MTAIVYAADVGVIFVAEAGNDGTDTAYYPKSYGSVIGIGSVQQQPDAHTTATLSTIFMPDELRYMLLSNEFCPFCRFEKNNERRGC